MEWQNVPGGLALVVNGKIEGWVTTTINGGFLSGLCGTKTEDKPRSESLAEAKASLTKALNDRDSRQVLG